MNQMSQWQKRRDVLSKKLQLKISMIYRTGKRVKKLVM